MPRMQRLAAATVLGFYLLGVTAPAAQAAMVSENATLPSPMNLASLNSALDAASVQAALVRHGVDPELARERVNALSQDELNTLATRYGELPAGGMFVELVIIGFLVWAVLNATDYGGVFMSDDEKKTTTN